MPLVNCSLVAHGTSSRFRFCWFLSYSNLLPKGQIIDRWVIFIGMQGVLVLLIRDLFLLLNVLFLSFRDGPLLTLSFLSYRLLRFLLLLVPESLKPKHGHL